MSGYDDSYSPPDDDTTTGTATSRLRQGRAGQRRATKARLALSGASGSGKTWTALSVAERLADGGPVVVVDTEPADGRNSAAELYADRFRFDVIGWEAPYDPRDLALTLAELGDQRVPGSLWNGPAGGYQVIIVDSASHFWRGKGGTLDVAGGKFSGWKVATPVQDRLVDTILRSPAHVIVCTRAKQDYQAEQGSDGKQRVVKLGLAPIQRDDLEYEFQVVVMMDEAHSMEIGKTRAAVLAGERFAQNEQGRFADIYADWLNAGVELIRQADADQLGEAFELITDRQLRTAAKASFVALFGKPSLLTADQLPAALAWVAEQVPAEQPAGPAEAPPSTPADSPEPAADPKPGRSPRRAASGATAAAEAAGDGGQLGLAATPDGG